MGTSSTISLLKKDNTVLTIGCNYDGHITHNGVILFNYIDLAKLQRILELGDLSSLGAHVDIPPGITHNFDTRAPNVCTFYARDRGEALCKANTYSNQEDYLEAGTSSEYNYIFKEKNEKWYIVVANKLKPLSTEISKSLVQRDLNSEHIALFKEIIKTHKIKKDLEQKLPIKDSSISKLKI